MRYLAYDEVQIAPSVSERGLFTLNCPWLTCDFQLSGDLTLDDILHQLKSLPIAYHLPRSHEFGQDAHLVISTYDLESPCSLARDLAIVVEGLFETEWTWDVDAALQLATIPDTNTYDPVTLLTVARRFHHLDCIDNKMQDVYDRVSAISDVVQRKHMLATIVRQNHYVTACCESSLEPALHLADSARDQLAGFIKAERGHDKLLHRSLTSLGATEENRPTDAARALMMLLKRSAEVNFAAFCFNLDFFEKPQFKEQDALAEVLINANEADAAKPLQIHMNINDGGDHGEISSSLLAHMKPMSFEYAMQAVRIAELTSFSIAQVPHELARQQGF